MNSYSRCYLQAVSRGQLLFSVNICGKASNLEDDCLVDRFFRMLDDEILVLQPLVILNPQTHIAEKIITLTNRGLLTCTSIKGVIEWSKQTNVRWSEFDESSDQLPLLSAVDRFVTVSGSIEVLFFSLQGKLVARVPLEESLNYPVQCGESQFGETRSLLLQSPVHIVVYRTSNFSCNG